MDFFSRHITSASSRIEDESILLKQFLKGDDEAFSTLYNRNINRLFAYGKGLGFDDDCLKDAIHDIFCKLYADRKLVKDIGNFKSYLFRALKNHLLNDLQKDTRNTSLERQEREFVLKVNVLDTLIEEEERVYIEQMLEKCFRCLTGRQKEAIWLRFIQEMDYEEIGIQLDMTPHAVRKLISRAILRIRQQQFPFSPLALYFMLISEKK
ncbi:MAG: RNA polymerase sigma factor [Odoribacter splanchnicus]|jgi:RNA polymerase sigma factor, sigma-70 family